MARDSEGVVRIIPANFNPIEKSADADSIPVILTRMDILRPAQEAANDGEKPVVPQFLRCKKGLPVFLHLDREPLYLVLVASKTPKPENQTNSSDK